LPVRAQVVMTCGALLANHARSRKPSNPHALANLQAGRGFAESGHEFYPPQSMRTRQIWRVYVEKRGYAEECPSVNT
jgi:hypothetical protein